MPISDINDTSVSAWPLRAGALRPGDVGSGVRLGWAVQDPDGDQGAELLECLRDREPGGEDGADEFLAPSGREPVELLRHGGQDVVPETAGTGSEIVGAMPGKPLPPLTVGNSSPGPGPGPGPVVVGGTRPRFLSLRLLVVATGELDVIEDDPYSQDRLASCKRRPASPLGPDVAEATHCPPLRGARRMRRSTERVLRVGDHRIGL